MLLVVEVLEEMELVLHHHPIVDLVAAVQNLMVLLHITHPHKEMLVVLVVKLETMLEMVVAQVAQHQRDLVVLEMVYD
jgi:allophanate hydrolase subunit 1